MQNNAMSDIVVSVSESLYGPWLVDSVGHFLKPSAYFNPSFASSGFCDPQRMFGCRSLLLLLSLAR